MKILRNYILKECITPFFLCLGVLTGIFLLGNLIPLTNLVINKGVSLLSIGKIFILSVPVLLGYTLPIACLIGVIIAFSRLSSDNEIMAIRANGIHLTNILFPLAILGLILSLFCIILNERVIPFAHHKQRVLMKNLGVENPTALLEAGVFISSFNGQILFIHKIDGYKLTNVTIYQPQEKGPTRTIIAKRGEFTTIPGKEQIKLKLMEGTADQPDLKNGNSFYKINFDNYFITLDLSNRKQIISKKPKSMSLKELREEIVKMEQLLVDVTDLRTEYWRKITWSFSPFVFILIGFPIAVITNKREKSANVLFAVICTVIYYLLSMGAEALSSQRIADPAWVMWMPNLIGITTAGILNLKCVS
ncbi:MAG: LptF/LptG family permease [Candidatus Omnitrophica bacterium]|nr:LptF/LptG family permease [Candidatus Omnitrophota bacterium]